MAGASQNNSVLSHFQNLEPVKGTMKFVDPNTGKVIKLKIDETPSKRRSWGLGFRKPRRKTQPVAGDYTKQLAEPHQIRRVRSAEFAPTEALPQAGCNPRPETPPAGSEDDYEYIPGGRPPPTDDASQDGYTPAVSSDEDSFDEECEEIYNALKLKASYGYANVKTNAEPLYSTVSKGAPSPP